MRHLFFFIIFSLPSSYIHRESPPFFLTWGRESNTFHVVLFVPLPNDNPHSSDFFPPPLYIVWTILFHSQFLYVHTRVYAFQQYTLIRMWSKGPFFSYLPCRLFFLLGERKHFLWQFNPPARVFIPIAAHLPMPTHISIIDFRNFFTRRKPLFVPSSIVSFIYARHSCFLSKFHN